MIDSLLKWSCSIDCQAHIFFFKTKNCSDDDIFISCDDRIGKMLHNICMSAVAMSLKWETRGPWASCFYFKQLLNVPLDTGSNNRLFQSIIVQIFLCWIYVLMFYNNIVKILEKLIKQNLRICLQVTYHRDFCIICTHFYYGKKWKYLIF